MSISFHCGYFYHFLINFALARYFPSIYKFNTFIFHKMYCFLVCILFTILSLCPKELFLILNFSSHILSIFHLHWFPSTLYPSCIISLLLWALHLSWILYFAQYIFILWLIYLTFNGVIWPSIGFPYVCNLFDFPYHLVIEILNDYPTV